MEDLSAGRRTGAPSALSLAPAPGGGSGDAGRSRSQISHDIHHEIGTIMLLASLLIDEPDAGPESRRRARLILGETRWLERLQRAYDSAADDGAYHRATQAEPVRIDDVCRDAVDAVRGTTLARVTFTATRVHGWVNPLAFWRALRNILDNAVRAAGRDGRVEVRIYAEDGWVHVEVDDDGPGFGAASAGRSALGLHIVQEFVAAAGGQFEIDRGLLGGCRVCMQIPEASDAGQDVSVDVG